MPARPSLLAQESGALARPLLECAELLVYFRMDPIRVDTALERGLPRPGDVAIAISGQLQGLRDYLNANASRLSLNAGALGHLIDFESVEVRKVQGHDEHVLKQNLRSLLAMMIWCAIEAVNCVSVAEDRVDQSLADHVMDLRHQAFAFFDS